MGTRGNIQFDGRRSKMGKSPFATPGGPLFRIGCTLAINTLLAGKAHETRKVKAEGKPRSRHITRLGIANETACHNGKNGPKHDTLLSYSGRSTEQC